MHHSRISVIQGHNFDNNTDVLYEPLRKTCLLDTTAKKTYLQDVSRVSHISHIAKPHTYVQNHNIGEQTLIPEDVRLRPSFDQSKIPKNRNYCIINAEERVFEPISKEEFERRTKNKEQVIVYTYGNEEDQDIRVKPLAPVIRQKKSGIKIVSPKYNLFSIIDEPVNNVLSGAACSCPANQLIASRRNEVDWDGISDLPEQIV